jgi:hypothetical protein
MKKNSTDSVARTLVFPAVGQAAIDYVSRACALGEQVICAAAHGASDEGALGQPVMVLPAIYDSVFPEKFLEILHTHHPTRIFSPVASVYRFLKAFIAEHELAIDLVGDSPIKQEMLRHSQLMARARRLHPLVVSCSEPAAPPSVVDVAGILRQTSIIYGESNDEKLAALMGVFTTAPKGDVVEIGSLMGRSAFVLLSMAKKYSVGPVVTVDPWKASEAIQAESPLSFQRMVDEWDFEILREGFFVNTASLAVRDHAHLQMPSVQAFAEYASRQVLCSPWGDSFRPQGTISLIHIDGNHDYDSVSEDYRLWGSRIVPGGWLILDDYIWAHGDGPYRVGNEILQRDAGRIARAFVCGKALFICWKG